MRRDFLAHLLLSGANALPSTETAASPAAISTESVSRSRFRVQPETTVTPAAQAVNDAAEDLEPAVITNRFGTIDRTTTAYTKFATTLTPSHYWSTTTDYVNFIGGALPPAPNTNRASDPMLAESPFINGLFPKRTYCTGTSYTIAGVPPQLMNSALTVWHTDDPGSSANPCNNIPPTPWCATAIATVNNPLVIDKPSVAVSWHSGSLGYTYVVTVVVNMNTNVNTFQVYRQTSAAGFTLVNNLISGAGITSPIVIVDNNSGDVYLLWVNYNNNTINIARSINMGNDFGAPVAYAAGAINNTNGTVCDINNANCVRGASVIMARPNATDGSIGVVWHRREAGSNNTDVYFNSFVYLTQSWRTERLLNDFARGDQWNPALDPASNGNYMTIWYDRRDDPNDLKYIVYGAKVTASGDAVDPSNTLVYSNIRASDPTRYTVDTSQIPNVRYLGEYQDIWEWFGTWYGATIYIPDPATGGSGQGDVYIPRITP